MTYTQRLVSMVALAGMAAVACSGSALAQVAISDDFTLSVDSNNWQTFGGACLTAGNPGGSSSIPACVGLPYYKGQIQVGGNSGYLGQSSAPSNAASQIPDPTGLGALRFTNSANNQSGGIISGYTFGTGSGVQVLFKTVTYRGDSGGSGKDGADGMSFFLLDGGKPVYDVGAFGGSLGYTCSNTNNDSTNTHPDGSARGYDGVRRGYLGLGIDEYGNFLNQGDNTATGFNYVPNRIGLRGAGDVSWPALNALNSTWYPSSLTNAQRAAAVQATCQSGYAWDYSNPAAPVMQQTAVADYPVLYSSVGVGAYTVLGSGFQIAQENAVTRSDGTPITYNLKITQNGLLSLSYSTGGAYQSIITNQSIVNSNGAIPGSFRFGFAGSTGGSTNVHEILCFQATPSDLAGSSVGVNEKQATKVASGTQAFLAYYYPSTDTGRLTASDLLYDAQSQSLSIAANANWDASCNLTGIPAGAANACPTTKVVGPVAAQAPTSRAMLTWSDTQQKGVAFEWTTATSGSAISTNQQNFLDAGDATPINANRLNYLRGDRTNEITSLGVGTFRSRQSVLGDIVDSSPTWVGPPTSPYTSVWKDLIRVSSPTPENSGTQNYNQYLSSAQTRLNVVYNGANDGFLHGFRAGSFDANGNFVGTGSTPNDGLEVLAYMPAAVVQTIHNTNQTLDFANPQYGHNFYVDATPGVNDLFYNGTWHTWLVGGLGPGGAAIYSLDVTDPTQFSEGNASKVVLGEWTSATIACGNVAACGNNLGSTYGVPIIRRLHDGKWGVIFGNGFGSATGDAGIFVQIVNPADGSIQSTWYYSTGKGTGTLASPCSSGCDGIAYVAPADLDGDHITDYIYAGDLLGNVWRFDLTGLSENSWGAASSPLFTVASGAPITTKLLVAIAPQPTGLPRVMVDFGTGRKTPVTNSTPAQFLTGSQKLYGVWDWNMANWNSLSTTQLASLTGPQTINDNGTTMQTQTLTPMGGYPGPASAPTGYLAVSNNPVCWMGSSTCTGGASANKQFGFEVPLFAANEQVIFSPLLYQNAFIINTTIPAVNTPTSCTVATDTGNTIAISVTTGGSLATTTGGVAKGFYTQFTDPNAAGDQTNGTGTPFVVQAGGNSFVLTQSLGNGNQSTGPLKCPKGALYCTGQISQAAATGSRLTWVERR